MCSCAIAIAIAIALATFAPLAMGQTHGKRDLAGARALDKEGARAYGEGRYADAIRYFEDAYRLGGPAFELWNVAKCHIRLDQPDKAAEMLERYLATPNLPKEDRADASQQLDQLKKRPSTLTVSSTPSGADVTVDGNSVAGQTPLSITVAPGPHTVTVSSTPNTPYTRQIEARYGRAVSVDATLARGDRRPPPPENPYDTTVLPLALRGALGISLPLQGSIGGRAGFGFTALGTYRVADMGRASIAVGGLLNVSGDSWDNRTGEPNEAPDCNRPLSGAESATALSFFAIGTGSVPVTPNLRFTTMGGIGLAGYVVGDVGGDVFVPSCHASPGVRPAVLIGTQVDYAITRYVRLTALPLTWQLQPAFGGTRAAPRDASGVWMRFGIAIGAGVDL